MIEIWIFTNLYNSSIRGAPMGGYNMGTFLHTMPTCKSRVNKRIKEQTTSPDNVRVRRVNTHIALHYPNYSKWMVRTWQLVWVTTLQSSRFLTIVRNGSRFEAGTVTCVHRRSSNGNEDWKKNITLLVYCIRTCRIHFVQYNQAKTSDSNHGFCKVLSHYLIMFVG
jgi:hypothetical protein